MDKEKEKFKEVRNVDELRMEVGEHDGFAKYVICNEKVYVADQYASIPPYIGYYPTEWGYVDSEEFECFPHFDLLEKKKPKNKPKI